MTNCSPVATAIRTPARQPAFVGLALLAVVLSMGCGPQCLNVGCVSGLFVSVDSPVAPGTYSATVTGLDAFTFDVDANGTVTLHCSNAGSTATSCFFPIATKEPPQSVTIKIQRDDTIWPHDPAPLHSEDVRPGGEACPVACWQGHFSFGVP
jgi:hypothetical protein